jgi:hypothetical protein
MGTTYWTPADTELGRRPEILGTVNDRALAASEVLQLQVPWSPIAPDIATAARPVAWLARTHGRSFALAIEWLDADRQRLRSSATHPWSFVDLATRALFTQSVLTAVDELRPEYLTLGVEVNFLALYNPDAFRAFVRLFPELKTAVKVVSPTSTVLVTFQYELVRGYHGRGPGPMVIPPHPELIEHFGSDLDMVGLATYPQIEFDDPAQLPDTFFDAVPDISKPIGIFETSWRTTGTPGSDARTQDRYLAWLLRQASSRGFQTLFWTSACDTLLQSDVPPSYLNTVYGIPASTGVLGLWTLGGTPKLAATRWMRTMTHTVPKVPTTVEGTSRAGP